MNILRKHYWETWDEMFIETENVQGLKNVHIVQKYCSWVQQNVHIRGEKYSHNLEKLLASLKKSYERKIFGIFKIMLHNVKTYIQ